MNLIFKLLIVFNLLTLSGFVYPQSFWQGVPDIVGSVLYYSINSVGDIFVSGGGSLLKSTDDGGTWIGVQPSIYTETAISINNADDIFAGTSGDGMYRSTDNGLTLTQINNGLPSLYVYSLAINQNDDIFAGLYLDICKSINNGNTWLPTNSGLTSVVTLDINSSEIIFAGANLLGIYKSTDNGANWNVCNNGLTTANIFKLSISPNDDIYLGTVNGGAFRSTNEGNSWMQIGLTGYEVRCFAFTPGGEIFAGTNQGVFKTTDSGANWTQMDTAGLHNPYVHCLFFNSAGYLFAGTGIGLCRSAQPIITSVTEPYTESSVSYSLSQNYPNPFNPSTKIIWQSPVGSFQVLKVFDVLGKEVATLVDEYKPAGTYEVEFKPTSCIHNLASGIYFYQLTAGSFVQTKKMILIK